MNPPESRARLLIIALVLVAVGIPLAFWASTPIVHARLAEDGGWTPEVVHATVGQPLRLHLTSDDVTHGFAVGQMDVAPVDVLPGKVTDVTLRFDKPGDYTFYCTRWCGLNHWRMRGTIEVSGPPVVSPPAQKPLYVALGLDLDAPRRSPVLPTVQPVARTVPAQYSQLLNALAASDYYRSHSPYQAWQALRGEAGLSTLSDQEVWDLTASMWRTNTSDMALATGRRTFAQNCAACHGETGRGNGVFANEIVGVSSHYSTADTIGDPMTKKPADLADPARMLAASPALLQGKIVRGGMGTGMPSWGPVFTQEQTWDLVAYLYSFQFSYPWNGG